MYIYKEKNTLLHKIHSLTLIMYVFSISVFSFVFSHPLYLFWLFVAVALVIKAAQILDKWLIYLKISCVMIIMVLVINTVFVQLGTTVLFWGPYLPVIGKIRITLEAILYGLNMGIRFLIIMSAFCLLTYVLHPDRALKLISRLGNKSVLAVTISIRLFPLMIGDFKRIYDAQRCRGVSFRAKNKFLQVRSFFSVINAMLLSSLERSFELAEALEARGYGVGKRTNYSTEIFRLRDYLIIFLLIVAIFLGFWLTYLGFTSFSFYPRLGLIQLKEGWYAFFYSLLFIFPALLNWGWKKYPLLRLKI